MWSFHGSWHFYEHEAVSEVIGKMILEKELPRGSIHAAKIALRISWRENKNGPSATVRSDIEQGGSVEARCEKQGARRRLTLLVEE